MKTILDQIIANKQQEVALLKQTTSIASKINLNDSIIKDIQILES